MPNSQMQSIAKQIVEAGFTVSRPMIPCTEDDVLELEHRFDVKLPMAYKNFLLLMGRQAGDFLNDASWRYPLKSTLPGALSLLADNASTFELPPKAFVFLYRDNFFLFFDTEAGEDPPVSIFTDGSKEPELFFTSFSEWLRLCVKGELAIREECAELEKESIDRSPQVNPN